jgi:hypothetical protein
MDSMGRVTARSIAGTVCLMVSDGFVDSLAVGASCCGALGLALGVR